MKVLYLLRYYPTLTETFVHQEIAALAAQGVDLTIASLGSRADGALHPGIPGVTLWPVPRRPLRTQLHAHSPGSRWLSAHRQAKEIPRYHWLKQRCSGFDRIHVHFAGGAAEWACALHRDLGIPFTLTVHSVDLFKPRPSFGAVLQDAADVITIAAHHKALLQEHGIDAVHIPCGPDLRLWKPSPLPPGPFQALFIGRNMAKKGLDVLLSAWEQAGLAGAELKLITDPCPAHTPAGVTHLGFLSPEGVRAQIHNTHLVVLPCVRAPDGDMDGIPVVLMEALACGRPVLSTPISGIPELVDEAVGWWVPPGDVGALTTTLRRISGDREAMKLRGSAGPARLRDRGFTLTDQVAGLTRVWRANATGASSLAGHSSPIRGPDRGVHSRS